MNASSAFNPSSSARNRRLTLAGSGLAALGLGGLAWGLSRDGHFTNAAPDPDDGVTVRETAPASHPADAPAGLQIAPPADVPLAQSAQDSMSFQEAFHAARAEVGTGGMFEWHGQFYNTNFKEEWEALSPEDQQHFLDSVEIAMLEQAPEVEVADLPEPGPAHHPTGEDLTHSDSPHATDDDPDDSFLPHFGDDGESWV